MAVVPMQKVGIVAHRSDFEGLTARLAELGMVQVSTREKPLAEAGKETETRLSAVERAIAFLAQWVSKKPTPLELTYEKLRELAREFPIEKTTDEIDENRRSIEELSTRENSLQQRISALEPFASLPFSFADLESMSEVRSRVGFVSNTLRDKLLEGCPTDLCEQETFNTTPSGLYVLFVFHKSVEAEVEEFLSGCGFAEFHPGKIDGLPADELAKLQAELSEVKTSLRAAKEKAQNDATQYLPTLNALRGYLEMELSKARLADLAERTEQTLFLTGWIKAADFERLRDEIDRGFGAVALEKIAPDEGEAAPVALKNPPVIEAFEVITDLYGRPRAGMIDPTPFIAPFFPLFFALCLTDAGYGSLLALFSGGMLLFGKQNAGTRKFMRLVFYSGIATIVAGALAGGWFGLDLASMDNGLARALLSIKVFDPLGNAIEFFAASVFLGVLQVSVGFGLNGYIGVREAPNGALKLRAALLSISWISVTIGSGVFIANYLIPNAIAPILPVGLGMFKFGALGIVAFSLILGILGKRGLGASIGDGIGFDGLYGIVSLFGDLLSYARILALGLSTGVIAGVIDIIAKQLASMIPGVGIVIAALLVIVGHAAYTGLSALGAFVHPARLHFVEYFGKFYEAGGKPFKPFKRVIDGAEIVK